MFTILQITYFSKYAMTIESITFEHILELMMRTVRRYYACKDQQVLYMKRESHSTCIMKNISFRTAYLATFSSKIKIF